jgi:hypothetical protein
LTPKFSILPVKLTLRQKIRSGFYEEAKNMLINTYVQ